MDNVDITDLFDRIDRGCEFSFYYKGKPYFVSDDGPGPSVRPTINNTGDPIFTLSTDKTISDLVDTFKLDGVTLRDLIIQNTHLRIDSIY